MNRDRSPPTTAYDLLLIDSELVHLRRAISLELTSENPVLPLYYWRRRVTKILETQHLLPAQLAIASEMLEAIASGSGDDRLYAKAS